MKRFFVFLVAILMSFTLSGIALATPLYYTFEGAVSIIVQDDAGIIEDAGLGTGSYVTYTFLVDYDREGTSPDQPSVSYPDGAIRSFNYFYADYISGSKLQETPIGDETGVEMTTVIDGVASVQSYLLSGGSDNQLSVQTTSSNSFIGDWTIGTDVRGSDVAQNSNGKSWMFFNASLTNISDTLPVTPVPEPSTFLLLGSGIAGLIFYRRRIS